jgi:hypothetical protein
MIGFTLAAKAFATPVQFTITPPPPLPPPPGSSLPPLLHEAIRRTAAKLTRITFFINMFLLSPGFFTESSFEEQKLPQRPRFFKQVS